MTPRRLALLAAAFVGLVLIVSAALAPASSSAACDPACGHGSVARNAQSSPSALCIHDAGCGGAAALAFGANNATAALAVGSAAVGLTLISRRRRFVLATLPSGVRLPSGLYRPPRLSFDA